MPDMNENSETQQEYFGKTMEKDYRGKAIKQYFSISKERCLFNDESLQNAFYEGFLDCAEFLLPLIEKMKCCGNCENGELSAHEEPCRHCQRCFASKDVTDQENVKDNWEAIKEIKENG